MTVFARFFDILEKATEPSANELAEVSSEALLFLAEWYLFEGEKKEAKRIYQQLIAAGEFISICESAILLIDGDVQPALERLAFPLEDSPKELIESHLARALLNSGNLELAEQHFTKALTIAPSNIFIKGYLAFTLRLIGKVPQSTELFQEACTSYKNSHYLLFNIGINYNLLDNNSLSLSFLRRAAQVKPDDFDTRLNLGLVLHTLGSLNEAYYEFEQCKTIEPNHLLLNLYLGTLCNELQKSSESYEYLTQAIKTDPSFIDAYVELANLHDKNNNIREMESVLKKALLIAPNDPRVLFEVAKLGGQNRQYESALDVISQLEGLPVSHRVKIEMLFTKARLLDGAGYYKKAYDYFIKANNLNKKSPRRGRFDEGALQKKVETLLSWQPNSTAQLAETQNDIAPVFLIGMPRSGVSLLTSFLDAHPKIATIIDKPTVEDALYQSGYDLNQILNSGDVLDKQAQQDIQKRYIVETERYINNKSNSTVIDILSLRFLNLPVINQIFPNAKYIFINRHPYDVILSNFMQQYHPTEALMHFDSIEHSTNAYVSIMNAWQNCIKHLSSRVLTLRYEQLIDTAKNELEKLTNFIQVEYTDDMISNRSLNGNGTGSEAYYPKVQPMYRDSIGRWRNYHFAFEQAPRQLEQILVTLGYVDA